MNEVKMKHLLALLITALFFGSSFVQAASAPPTIRVAYTSITGNRAPFWIAKEAKLLRDPRYRPLPNSRAASSA